MGAYPECIGVGARALGVLWLDHAFNTLTAAEGGCPEGNPATVGNADGPAAAEGGPEAAEDGPGAAEVGPGAARNAPATTEGGIEPV